MKKRKLQKEVIFLRGSKEKNPFPAALTVLGENERNEENLCLLLFFIGRQLD